MLGESRHRPQIHLEPEPLRTRIDFGRLAAANRLLTHEELKVAICELAARGLGDHEIAQACEISVDDVRRALGERQP